MARTAHALSEHPLASHATGEVVGAVLEAIDEPPSVAVLFVSGHDEIEDVVFTVREILRPDVLVGCTASSVIGGRREVEDRPAIAVWAACGLDAEAVRLRVIRTAEGVGLVGWPGAEGADGLLLLADPFTFPAAGFLEHLAGSAPGFPVTGGLASGGQRPGETRLVVDGVVVDDGAVGVLFRGGARLTTVVSQGCRPIGDPYTVTEAEGGVIRGLGGRPPVERLQDHLATLDEQLLATVQRGLHVGLAIDEGAATPDVGDFLIRNVRGIDPDSGALATDEEVPVGTTLQFQVRDAFAADEDLRHRLAGHRAAGALLFTCNGRGSHLFTEPDHDASVVSDALDDAPLAGMFCAGEIGPVGRRSYLHGFTASLLLVDAP